MLSYRLKVSSPYSPENVLIPTKSENLKEPPPLPFPTDIPGCDSRSWGRAGDFPFYDGWGSRMASLRARLLFKARLRTFCF